MTRPLVLLLSSCLATTAAAQSLTATLTTNQLADYEFGPSKCGTTIPVNWKVTAGTCTQVVLNLWVTTGSCAATPGTGDQHFVKDLAVTATTGIEDLPVNGLPGATDGGVVCGSPRTVEYTVCGSVPAVNQNTLNCTEKSQMISPPSVLYDGQPPDAPVLESLQGVDNGLVAKVAPAEGTHEIQLEYKLATEPDTAYRAAPRFPATTTRATIEGLDNNIEYAVRAYGLDKAGNISAASAVLAGAPVNSQGFFGYYVDAGGAEVGGCSTAGGVAILPAALFALWSLIRRRRS